MRRNAHAINLSCLSLRMGCGSSAVLGRKATAVTHQGYSDTVVADGGNFRSGDGQCATNATQSDYDRESGQVMIQGLGEPHLGFANSWVLFQILLSS